MQAHDIGKSIAAFASSNDGRLIYGVADDGMIIGLTEADAPKERDRILQRISGAARDVKPPIHPRVTWAIHDGKVACVVTVEKGVEALYYSNQRPIIRRGPISRPAEPGEVEEVFRKRYAGNASAVSLPSTKQIGQRLHRVLDLINQKRYEPVTIIDLARAMGLTGPAELEAVFEGIHAPTFAMLDQFCACFAVDKDWLATGRGQPFTSSIAYRPHVSDYLDLIEADTPECVYLVRSKSEVGESFIVIQSNALKFWRLPDVWHVSDHVGGGGRADLLSLYELFQRWINEDKNYMILGRLVEPKLAEAIFNGEVYPGIVEKLPLSHWWDDLTDLDCKWTLPEQSQKVYGKGFFEAQNLLREMIGLKKE